MPPIDTLTPAMPNAAVGITLAPPLATSPEIVAPVAVAGGVGDGEGVGVASLPEVSGAVGDFGVDPPQAAARTLTRTTGSKRRSDAVMGPSSADIAPGETA